MSHVIIILFCIFCMICALRYLLLFLLLYLSYFIFHFIFHFVYVWFTSGSRLVQEYMKRFDGEENINRRLLFHGTPNAANIRSIVRGGFLLSKVGSTTDAGFYGRGIYFSEHTHMSMAYTRGVSSMLCCEVLIGKPYKAPLKIGASLHQPHKYTSHVSDASCQEVVIFDMHAILPRYVVHFKKGKGRGGGALQEALVGLGGGGGGVFGGMGGGGGVDPGVTAFSGHGKKLGDAGQ